MPDSDFFRLPNPSHESGNDSFQQDGIGYEIIVETKL